ncbi:MAG: hypothetical protein LBU82_07900, partial [Treponema sp.]|nr:hypothetical protein [Treponema sp.]
MTVLIDDGVKGIEDVWTNGINGYEYQPAFSFADRQIAMLDSSVSIEQISMPANKLNIGSLS